MHAFSLDLQSRIQQLERERRSETDPARHAQLTRAMFQLNVKFLLC